jgi:hypothetical protein
VIRNFQFGRIRLQGMFDAYNIFNNAAILDQLSYGAQYRRPTNILDARILKGRSSIFDRGRRGKQRTQRRRLEAGGWKVSVSRVVGNREAIVKDDRDGLSTTEPRILTPAERLSTISDHSAR